MLPHAENVQHYAVKWLHNFSGREKLYSLPFLFILNFILCLIQQTTKILQITHSFLIRNKTGTENKDAKGNISKIEQEDENSFTSDNQKGKKVDADITKIELKKMEPYILLIACKDQKGFIYNITKILFEHNLNIVSNGEFVEKETCSFFMRTEFEGIIDKEAIVRDIQKVLPTCAFIQLAKKRKKDIIVLATKESHCVGDLLIRYYSNDLNANIVSIISNHNSLKELAEKFNIEFHYIDHKSKTREEHEKELINTIRQYNPEYLVLAKYMRILSQNFISKFPNRVINIHHSFLPAFIGAKPYEQAFERGVKIIGATAHFVDENLDGGPIITQNVIPVSHFQSASDMDQAGKDVEKIVLAKALKLVLEERVFISRNKTILFS